MFVCVSVYQYACVSVHQCIHVSVCSFCVSMCLCILPLVYMPISASVCPCICSLVCPLVYMHSSASVCPCIWPLVRLRIIVPVYQCVRASVYAH